MNIDWTQAPAWAQYHAFDEDGRCFWYETKPYISGGFWCVQGDTEWSQSVFTLPTGQDWRQSLVERPKEETK